MDETYYAHIDLLPTADGGLREPMPLPTTSLLLVFDSLDVDSPSEVQVGAHIVSGGRSSISAGDRVPVTVDFWAEVGRIYATPGTPFRIWYAGRVVGVGQFGSADGESRT
jgi:hypothetical protein